MYYSVDMKSACMGSSLVERVVTPSRSIRIIRRNSRDIEQNGKNL